MAVTIEYNLVEAHYHIDRLRREKALLEEGLRDYAESDWWKQDNPTKSLETHVKDAVRDYTLE